MCPPHGGCPQRYSSAGSDFLARPTFSARSAVAELLIDILGDRVSPARLRISAVSKARQAMNVADQFMVAVAIPASLSAAQTA